MTKAPSIVAATLAYERWLGQEIDRVDADIKVKHREMAGSATAFLCATYYHWAMLWEEVCADLAEAPRVLALGDIHVANFGTWRDGEGRLIWGVNDFDEAAAMPYAADLVRLTTSANLARRDTSFNLGLEAMADAILEGYRGALEMRGDPLVLEESHGVLRSLALRADREPAKFWAKLRGQAPVKPKKSLRHLLTRSLPDGAEAPEFRRRVSGLGSLGRPRIVAISFCRGGLVAREAKVWVPSAWGWAQGKPKARAVAIELLAGAVRQRDPFYTLERGWILRRLAPHCSRIELSQFAGQRHERHVLLAMGHELANLHLASARDLLLRDLDARPAGWLAGAARRMSEATLAAWREFRASRLAPHKKRLAKRRSAKTAPR